VAINNSSLLYFKSNKDAEAMKDPQDTFELLLCSVKPARDSTFEVFTIHLLFLLLLFSLLN